MKLFRSCVALVCAAAAASASDDDFKTEVKVLDTDSFAAFQEGSTPALVMFQAPWCGHCKAFKPLFGKAAKLVNAQESLKFGFGTVDCDGGDGKPLCGADKFNVTSFPTTYFFADKDAAPVKYEDARTTKGLKAFVKKKLGLEGPFPGDENFVNDDTKWEDGGNVVHQTEDHFDAHLAAHPSQFVMFYAPWCGHCKKFKPVMIEASRKVKAAPLVAVDCTEEDPLCRKWNITGYPTFYWCAGPAQENCEKYSWSGSEDANDLRSYIENKVESAARKSIGTKKLEAKDVAKLRVRVLRKMLKERGLACKGCTDKKEFIKMLLENQDVKVEVKKHKLSWGEEQRRKKSLEVAEKGWELENEKVAHLTDYSYPEARKTQTKPMLLMFYAPWCTHCKDLKPKWAEGATAIGDQAIVAAIDCDSNEETCGKFKVESFPTLKYFADAKDEGAEYKGGRDASGMAKFVKGKLQVGAGSAWVGEPVNVKHIEDAALDKYVEENPKFLLMMYTKTCEKCKAMMPVFAEASGKASDANTGFAAADCATDPKTCIKFGIKNPKVLRSAVLKFVDGGAAVAYKGKKDAKGLSDFAVEMDEEPGKDEL